MKIIKKEVDFDKDTATYTLEIETIRPTDYRLRDVFPDTLIGDLLVAQGLKWNKNEKDPLKQKRKDREDKRARQLQA